jgi:hypothetical protein
MLESLAQNRSTYKHIGGSVTDQQRSILLQAATGITPALCNEYNWRVDQVPDHLKDRLFSELKHFDKRAVSSLQPLFVRNENPQLTAPLLLVWSLRWKTDNASIYQHSGPITSRDSSMISLGMSVWHLLLVAESLGLKTGLVTSDGSLQIKAKEILGLELQNDRDRYSDFEFMPLVFCGIGSTGTVSLSHRSHRCEPVVDQLKIS